MAHNMHNTLLRTQASLKTIQRIKRQKAPPDTVKMRRTKGAEKQTSICITKIPGFVKPSQIKTQVNQKNKRSDDPHSKDLLVNLCINTCPQ